MGKGHQDDDKQYEELPLEAQLNIDADELAGIFQQRSGKSRPHSTKLSSYVINTRYKYHKQLSQATDTCLC